MPIIEPVIRPPSEAESFLLQITTGCSANNCTFCGAYRKKVFRIKDNEEIERDLLQGIKLYPYTRRVFLMDGDALIVSNDRLLPILESIKKGVSKLSRVSSYANGYNITKRRDEELRELFAHDLKLIYIGLESGNQAILNSCRKQSSVEEMIEAVNKAAGVGIKSSVIVLLGLGGKKYSQEHVADTIEALNRMQPRYLSFLSLMLIPGTELHSKARKGEFKELNSFELLEEMYSLIKGLELKKTIFRSNHASNYLPLEGRFPQDKEKLLNIIGRAINGGINLRPEFFRAL